jgi:hypothetical protein
MAQVDTSGAATTENPPGSGGIVVVNTLLLPYEEPAALLSLTSEEPAARPLGGMENGPRPLPPLIETGADGGSIIP